MESRSAEVTPRTLNPSQMIIDSSAQIVEFLENDQPNASGLNLASCSISVPSSRTVTDPSWNPTMSVRVIKDMMGR